MLGQRTLQNGPRSTYRYVSHKLKKATHQPPLWTKQPTSLQLDTTNQQCTLDCVYCNPQHSYNKYGTGTLPLTVINYIIAELKRNKVQINYSYPFMNSDPLLEPRLPYIVKQLKKHLHCLNLVSTNGVYYQNRHLLSDTNLNDVCFTVSAVDEESYNRIHGKPLYKNVLKTVDWLTKHKHWNQRIQLRYIIFNQNSDNLGQWQQIWKDYPQEIRPLHWGETRKTSKEVNTSNSLIEYYQQKQQKRFMLLQVPCNCFHNLSISFDGQIMQCCDLPYTENWGHVEEVDILETWHKRLDLGLNHKGCKNCNQKNAHWKELFERFTLSIHN